MRRRLQKRAWGSGFSFLLIALLSPALWPQPVLVRAVSRMAHGGTNYDIPSPQVPSTRARPCVAPASRPGHKTGVTAAGGGAGAAPPPTTTSRAMKSPPAGGVMRPVTFPVNAAEADPVSWSITATSSDTALVPAAN